MKVMLYDAVNGQSTIGSNSNASKSLDDSLSDYLKEFEDQFFEYCFKELEKINTFFAEKLAEATRKFVNLKNELSICLDRERRSVKSFSSSKRKTNNTSGF